ncbi:MAG: calcium/proton exchanger [Acidimicrobiales bacterium]
MAGLGRRDVRLVAVTGLLTGGAAVTRYVPSGRVVPFVVAAIALAALAALVGRAVDGLGDRLGSGATGVLQSALGNIPELLFGIFALRQGLVTVVQATIVGSILSNVLLVLGLAIVVGGLRHGTQRFSAEAPRTVSLLLLLAVAVLIVPTVTARLHLAAAAHEHVLSDVAAVVLLAVFALAVPASLRRSGAGPATGSGADPAIERPTGDSGGPGWPLSLAVALLVASGGAAALVSDWFVAALTPALSALHLSQSFAGLVVVAIAGNAVENVVGIQLAARDRMDYALAVTLQSPVQVALAVAPLLVLISPALGGTTLTLVFPPLLVVVLAITAVIAVIVVFDGESTWIEGVCLVGLYVVVAAAFWWG